MNTAPAAVKTMPLKLDRPLVFFDLEATGVDVARDRIVQVACVRVGVDGSRSSFESLVDPQIPIPAEATQVHHITDEMVRGAPSFRELAPRLLEFFGDCDFGGFGICRFDLPMLSAEFKRAGLPFDLAGRRAVDALIIFHKMEPRNLAAAMQFYCGKTLEDAHHARADAEAALAVFEAQLSAYGDPKGIKSLPADLQAIHELCNAVDPKHVDPKGKFVWRHGVATFNFGKYHGRPLEEVARIDRSYLEWLGRSENSSAEVCEICRKALAGVFPSPAEKAKAR